MTELNSASLGPAESSAGVPPKPPGASAVGGFDEGGDNEGKEPASEALIAETKNQAVGLMDETEALLPEKGPFAYVFGLRNDKGEDTRAIVFRKPVGPNYRAISVSFPGDKEQKDGAFLVLTREGTKLLGASPEAEKMTEIINWRIKGQMNDPKHERFVEEDEGFRLREDRTERSRGHKGVIHQILFVRGIMPMYLRDVGTEDIPTVRELIKVNTTVPPPEPSINSLIRTTAETERAKQEAMKLLLKGLGNLPNQPGENPLMP